MANYRLVNTAMWDDEWFSDLDYTERYLFIYLLTNPLTNIAGIYQVPLKRIVFDTGIDMEMLKRLMTRFQTDNKMFYELGYVVIKNWHKHQHLNTNQMTAAVNHVNGLPEWLRKRLLDENDDMFIDFATLLKASIPFPNPSLTLGKPFATREVKEKRSEREF